MANIWLGLDHIGASDNCFTVYYIVIAIIAFCFVVCEVLFQVKTKTTIPTVFVAILALGLAVLAAILVGQLNMMV